MGNIVKERTIVKEYENFYTGRRMTYPIVYQLQPGFRSVGEAKESVGSITNPENFLYIRVDDELYAVTMEMLGKQCVVTKGVCRYRNGAFSVNGFSGEEELLTFEELKSKGKTLSIQKVRVGQWWNDELKKDIESLFSVSIEYTGENVPNDKTRMGKTLVSDSIVLIGTILFASMVPVYYLNVMDAYMNDSPSRWKLWREGITAYNPYSKKTSHDIHIIGGTKKLM